MIYAGKNQRSDGSLISRKEDIAYFLSVNGGEGSAEKPAFFIIDEKAIFRRAR
jgi:hypothetical protein